VLDVLYTVEARLTERHEASRGLFATAELLVVVSHCASSLRGEKAKQIGVHHIMSHNK